MPNLIAYERDLISRYGDQFSMQLSTDESIRYGEDLFPVTHPYALFIDQRDDYHYTG